MYTREEILAEKARRASLNNPDAQSGLERQGKNLLIGYANLGHNVLNLPHNVAGMFSDELASKIPYQQEQNFAKIVGQERDLPIDRLVQGLGEYGPSFAIPGANLGKLGSAIGAIPKAGNAIKAGLSFGLPQGAYTLGNEIGAGRTDDALANAATTTAMAAPFGAFGSMAGSLSPKVRAAGKYGAMGLGGYLGHELGDATGIPFASEALGIGSAILAGKGINVNREAKRTVFDDLNPSEAKELVEASRRIGLDFITPGEAIENPFVAQEHARIGKTRGGSRDLYQAGKKRAASEEKSLNTLFDQIYNKSLDPEKKRLYDLSMETHVPDEVQLELYDSSTIKKAMKGLESDPVYKDLLKDKDYKPDTIGYWNEVKRVLDGMHSQTKDQTKKGVIDRTRKELLGYLDPLDPIYPEARSYAEREITVRNIKKHFNTSDVTGNRFSKLTQNKEKFNELRGKLKAFPDAQQMLDDMALVFPRLQNFNPTNKATAALERTGMSTARNFADAVRDYYQKNFFQGQDMEAVKLITSPDWMEQLSAYNASKPGAIRTEASPALAGIPGASQRNPDFIASIIEMLSTGAGKGLGQYAGRGEKNE